MAFKKNTKNIRVPIMFIDCLDKKMGIKTNKKLAKRNEIGNPEVIRLLMKTSGWKMSLKELEFKYKRRRKI